MAQVRNELVTKVATTPNEELIPLYIRLNWRIRNTSVEESVGLRMVRRQVELELEKREKLDNGMIIM